MAQRFGEFFQEPEWPFHSEEHQPHFSNLEAYDEQEPVLEKLEPQDHVKLEFPNPDSSHEEYSEPIEPDRESIYESEESLSQRDQSYTENGPKNVKRASAKIQQDHFLYDKGTDITNKQRNRVHKRRKASERKLKKSYECERGRYNILSEDLKKQIVQESKKMTMVEVARKYNVSVNNICRWRKRCDRRSGAGRKVTDMEMESRLLDWLLMQVSPIPRKEVQTMAKRMSSQVDFKASKGWFQRFYKRNKLFYNPNVEILTHNDYRQRISRSIQKQERAMARVEEMASSLAKIQP